MKIWIPAIVSLLALVVTNAIVIWKIGADNRASIRRQLTLDLVSRKRAQLEKFYNPIHALLETNGAIFNAFGPVRYRERESRAESVKVWSQMVTKVIIPNNSKICTIIRDNSDLLRPEDQLGPYLEFMKHAVSYEVFREMPNELHPGFPYPKDFESTVALQRAEIIKELQTIGEERPI